MAILDRASYARAQLRLRDAKQYLDKAKAALPDDEITNAMIAIALEQHMERYALTAEQRRKFYEFVEDFPFFIDDTLVRILRRGYCLGYHDSLR